ncbi:MAG: acyl-CoA dehydrogenase family protein [Deltaproteobacteria bacterium]|nr:acyl-CoA dehydrogenase family protein [Deltaproteobacteria bacterium]MBW2418695.1 acyl-CoA dehydrogenase family protein [Deltaproteobacteria bacterium]
MDLRYSEADEKFRAELRSWLEDAVPGHGEPPSIHDWDARRDYDTGWQRKLFDAGYAGINWPAAYGGRDASLTEQLVYYEEIARANAPYVGHNFVGLLHGGPTLIAEGTEEQKTAHVPRILRGEEVWCQGFSEPVAGSDLAALATRAVRDGDEYVVNGHKIWTSFAHKADYCELLVRTDPDAPKHRGISWLILPMDAEGIDIRPLKTLVGEGEFSEVFLEDVRVPVTNRVGEENDGWRVTNVTLRFERGTAFASEMVRLQQLLRELVELAKGTELAGGAVHGKRSAWDDPGLQREVGHIAAELDALWAMMKLSVCQSSKTGVPGLGGSALKLVYTELYQRIGELGMRLLDRGVLSREDFAGLPCAQIINRAMQSLSLTIAAGTSQIQRNIIAERILGLPKEPRP